MKVATALKTIMKIMNNAAIFIASILIFLYIIVITYKCFILFIFFILVWELNFFIDFSILRKSNQYSGFSFLNSA